MTHHEDIWGWMLAVDFFLAGMGAAVLAIAAIVDLASAGTIPLPVRLAAPALIAMGAGLLVLELGKPFEGWRVFMNPKSILTLGAANMTLAILFGTAKACMYLPAVAEHMEIVSNLRMQAALSFVLLALGIFVASYPGVLLARHVARPFWTGPGISVLFTLSSFLTAAALIELTNEFFPSQQSFHVNRLLLALVALQTILWPTYLYIKRTGTTKREAEGARKWICGSMAPAFWIGVFGCGSLFPFITLLVAPKLAILSAVLVLIGGAGMRYMVVLSGKERTWITGEQFYYSRLPRGDEPFLRS